MACEARSMQLTTCLRHGNKVLSVLQHIHSAAYRKMPFMENLLYRYDAISVYVCKKATNNCKQSLCFLLAEMGLCTERYLNLRTLLSGIAVCSLNLGSQNPTNVSKHILKPKHEYAGTFLSTLSKVSCEPELYCSAHSRDV